MKLNLPIEVIQATAEILDEQEKEFQKILEILSGCNFLLISNHGSTTYFKKFNRLIAKAKQINLNTFVESSVREEMADYRSFFSGTDEDYNFIHSCIELGGLENTHSFLLWAGKILGGYQIEIPALKYPPTEGCYHPLYPDDISFESHLHRLDSEKPTIGIFIHQYYYIRKNLRAVDALIDAIEKRGLNVLTIFLITSPDDITGSLGISRIVYEYLIKDGAPIIDCLIMNMGFSQISLSDPGDGTKSDLPHNFFSDLNVPVIQIMTTIRPYEAWYPDMQGLSMMEISSSIIWPEFDGQIIGIPLGTSEEIDGKKQIAVPITGRPERIAAMAHKWSELKRTPRSERKIAILLYQYTGEMDTLGDAGGLDTPQSLVEILEHLENEGYLVDHIPKDGNALIDEVIHGLTNDIRWITKDQMKERSIGFVDSDLYTEWFSQIPEKNQKKITADWGKPPGELFEIEKKLCIPGIMNGNIFIGIQPPRGYFEQIETLIHSTDLVMPHHYLAYYRWIKHIFGAHAVIHLGTHGTLEWLPGKGNALSEECYPDLIFEDMPHLYPYIINDPGEGMEAKRRTWAVLLDYLISAMMRAEGYGELSELDSILQEYLRAKSGGEAKKAASLIEEARIIVIDKNFTKDLGLSDEVTITEIEAHAERLYDYICELRDTIIKDGLHIFGVPPKGERFNEMIYSLTRLSNGQVPSLRECIAENQGLNFRNLLDNPSQYNSEFKKTNGMLIDIIDEKCRKIIGMISEQNYNYSDVLEKIKTQFGNDSSEIKKCIAFICNIVVPGLQGTTDEISNLISGLDGGYVPPGPSGDPTRGNVHLLPTGKNCYSIDPATIPTPASWKTGKSLADQMIERYITENGRYPENVGIVVWAIDTMRTGGDDIAYILWLMGLKPTWSDRGGAVTGLEVVPSSELGRPRIDVTLRISGMFRDSFPGLVNMIDEGVEIIASLDESEDINYLAAHLRHDLVLKIKDGISEDIAREMALIRIFGDPPGNHGGGVSDVVHASAWSERKDLADTFVNWGAHAYGRKFRGERVLELCRQQFGKLDATIKNRVSREWDVLDTDDEYMVLGGMNACVKTYGEKDPTSIMGDASDPENVKSRLLEEEIRFVVRSRVLNPAWFEGLKPHGFRGAQEVVTTVEYLFGWDATSDAVDDWEYQSITEHFLFNEANREWIEENNPYALHSISGRLLEANDRGLWNTDENTIEQLKSIYLSSDKKLEETGE